MERQEITVLYRTAFFIMSLIGIAAMSFSLGLMWTIQAEAAEKRTTAKKAAVEKTAEQPKVIYPKKTKLDFEGLDLEGELKNPAEFYFQHKPQEKFDSLVKPRNNFHREMLRDVVMSR